MEYKDIEYKLLSIKRYLPHYMTTEYLIGQNNTK